MNNYKADITLNEKDSLTDLLTMEKNMIKLYSTAMTEGVTKPFRTTVKNNWTSLVEDQLKVFLEMTDHGYYKVDSATEETLNDSRTKYGKIKSQLS